MHRVRRARGCLGAAVALTLLTLKALIAPLSATAADATDATDVDATDGHVENVTSERLERRNTLTTNPVRYALLHFQIEYERALATTLSAFVSPIGFHHATWYPFAHAPGMTAQGYGIDFGARYFFVGSAPSGAFVGPFLSAYRTNVFHDGIQTLEGYVFSPGVQGGYTHLIGPLVLSGGAGLSYGFASAKAPDGSPRAQHLPHHGLWVNFRANVGFAF